MAKAKPLTKSQIIVKLAEQNEMTKKDVSAFLDSLAQVA